MKNKIILLAIILSVISLLLGFLGKLINQKILLQNVTWLWLAQTALLFAIAWGIGKLLESKDKEV
jgi:hypothetical protein